MSGRLHITSHHGRRASNCLRRCGYHGKTFRTHRHDLGSRWHQYSKLRGAIGGFGHVVTPSSAPYAGSLTRSSWEFGGGTSPKPLCSSNKVATSLSGVIAPRQRIFEGCLGGPDAHRCHFRGLGGRPPVRRSATHYPPQAVYNYPFQRRVEILYQSQMKGVQS